MTDVTSNEVFDRVVRSLIANGKRIEYEMRVARIKRYWTIALSVIVFAAGFVAGLLVH
jgi:hypothetical protein